MGIDQIRQTDLSRRQGPSIIQPKQQRTRTIAEQANIHQDRLFAASYFKEGAWKNELEGVDNTHSKAQTSSLNSAMQILTLLHLSTKRRPT